MFEILNTFIAKIIAISACHCYLTDCKPILGGGELSNICDDEVHQYINTFDFV